MAEQFSNHAGTTLSAAITVTTRPVTFTVASTTGLPSAAPFRVLIDNDIILVTTMVGTSLTGSTVEGTTAATHALNAPVTHVLTAGAVIQSQADTNAALLAANNTFAGANIFNGNVHFAGNTTVDFGTSAGSTQSVQIQSQQSSPVSGRLLWGGDGSGWQLRIGKNQGGVVTDFMTFSDLNTITASQPLTMAAYLNLNNGTTSQLTFKDSTNAFNVQRVYSSSTNQLILDSSANGSSWTRSLAVDTAGAITISQTLACQSASFTTITNSGNTSTTGWCLANNLYARGTGQVGPFTFSTTGDMGGAVLLDSTQAVAYAGGAVVFTANTGAWKFAAIKGFATNGGNNTQGEIGFFIRPVATDASLTEAMHIHAGGQITHTGNTLLGGALTTANNKLVINTGSTYMSFGPLSDNPSYVGWAPGNAAFSSTQYAFVSQNDLGAVLMNSTALCALRINNVAILNATAAGVAVTGTLSATGAITQNGTGVALLSGANFTGGITASTVITSSGGAIGYVGLNNGNASQAGFVSWYRPNGTTRIAYMGWDPTNLLLNLENSSSFSINGGSVTFQQAPTFTDAANTRKNLFGLASITTYSGGFTYMKTPTTSGTITVVNGCITTVT